MDINIKTSVFCDDKKEIIRLLSSGLDPNYGGGWPIRLAARHGSYSVVEALIQYGANPHLLGESGASTLQLAVFSNAHWDADGWSLLLSCCDSSQLADGAAVAVIFRNIAALNRILGTGRCNTNIPTTLTGKTVEDLAKGYKLQYLLNIPVIETHRNVTPTNSPSVTRTSRLNAETTRTPEQSQRNLSPSVARFFHQTAALTALAPPRSPMIISSPTTRL